MESRNEECKGRNVLAPHFGLAWNLINGLKGGSYSRPVLNTKNEQKLHPKTKVPLNDNTSKIVDKTVNISDAIIDFGSMCNTIIQTIKQNNGE